jgi:hypothetical protein
VSVKTTDHRCEVITALMRSIDKVPAGARWRISWIVHTFTVPRRVWAYVLTDSVARRWCVRHQVEFPSAQAAPASAPVGAARTAIPHSCAVVDGILRDPRLVDHRARAAGEEY